MPDARLRLVLPAAACASQLVRQTPVLVEPLGPGPAIPQAPPMSWPEVERCDKVEPHKPHDWFVIEASASTWNVFDGGVSNEVAIQSEPKWCDGNQPKAELSTVPSTAVDIDDHQEQSLPPRGPMRPDWIMVGVPLLARREVMLLAGNAITGAHLERHLINLNAYQGRREPPRYKADVRVSLSEVTEIIAPDYPTALRELLKVWQPEAAQRREIER